MSLKELGILPRVGLAFVPWLTGELIDRWSFSCFGSQSPFCIYYFHPPGMDVMFALLVLALFMHARTRVALRVLALVVLGVFVHFLSIGLLVATRGSLDVPGIDTIWLNVIPVAVIASVVTVLLAAVVCGLKMTWRLGTYSALAGIPIAAGVLYPVLGVLLSPVIAGAAMALSSLTVVSNANRLRLFKARET